MHPGGIVGWVLRALQFLFAVIVLSLAAALVANQPNGGSPSQINYSVFVGVFSLLTWFYTVAASSFSPDGVGAPIICIVIDFLNTLFYFAGGVAMAVALRVHSCGNTAYVLTNKITAGSTQRCHEGQTLTAFLWFGMSCLLNVAD
jgi:Membrane-associating domain